MKLDIFQGLRVVSLVALNRRFWIENRAIQNRAIQRSPEGPNAYEQRRVDLATFRAVLASTWDAIRMAILNRFSAILLYCDSTFFLLLAAEVLAIRGPRFRESCDSRFCATKVVGGGGGQKVPEGPKPRKIQSNEKVTRGSRP